MKDINICGYFDLITEVNTKGPCFYVFFSYTVEKEINRAG